MDHHHHDEIDVTGDHISTTNGAVVLHPPNSSLAYVTFLAGDGDYVKGVVGLAKGLRKVKTPYPLVVAVLPDVPENHRAILLNQGCIIRVIEPVLCPPVDHHNGIQFARKDFVVNYSKLRLWKFVEYSRMVYLDADIQVYGNIDHLFDLPDGSLYASPDSFCETSCRRCPDKVRWPAILGPKPALYFNAGMFVFKPSFCTHDNLLATLKLTPPTLYAEQDLLNVFFRETCQPISPLYNLLLVMWWRHPEIINQKRVKVVHYCGGEPKPWKFTAEEIEKLDCEDKKMLIKKWWDIYNDESLDYHYNNNNNNNRSEEICVHIIKTDDEAKHFKSTAVSEAGINVHDHIANPSAA